MASPPPMTSSISPASAWAGRGRATCGRWPGKTSSPCATWTAKYAAHTFKTYPQAEVFKDYRVMLEKRKDIDAVMIATPDHMHAPITLAALRAGKHVYVEKPMAHSIEEARVMTRVAKETGLVTQMGNNGHGGEGLRLIREWIQAGVIGPVREIHCWSDRPGKFWKQDLDRPTDTPPVPPDLDWNLWLGGAAERPYHPVYCPRAWRGWFDFGTGALGDMAIHNMDPAFYALDLDAPVATEAQTSPLKKESYPAWTIITYEFAAKGNRPAVKIVWYDGGKMPPRPPGLSRTGKLADNGIYFVGDKGDDALRRLVRPAAAGAGEQDAGLPAARPRPFRAPSAIAPSGFRPARSGSPPTPRPGSPTPARSPRPCWWAIWPSACRSGSSGTPRP